MKKFMAIIILAVMLMASNLWAVAGSCVQTPYQFAPGGQILVKLVCTGSSVDGSIPTQTIDTDTMSLLTGTYYLYSVTAYRTPAGTAPDAADVAVLMGGQDLLGGKGTNLIHASATYDTLPYSIFMSSYRYPAIISALTLTVANQATVNANYTIELLFAR